MQNSKDDQTEIVPFWPNVEWRNVSRILRTFYFSQELATRCTPRLPNLPISFHLCYISPFLNTGAPLDVIYLVKNQPCGLTCCVNDDYPAFYLTSQIYDALNKDNSLMQFLGAKDLYLKSFR